jgi:hypothetical protein
MRNWNIANLLGLTMAILSTIRLAFAGLLLWAFQETDTPILRLSLWTVAMGMIGYVIWRIIKLYKFLKFDNSFTDKE